MMDYRVCESTKNDCIVDETPRLETTVKDQLEIITKKLYETDLALRSIIDNLIGAREKEESLLTEERCLRDSLFTVHQLSDDCMSMSHRIKELLF